MNHPSNGKLKDLPNRRSNHGHWHPRKHTHPARGLKVTLSGLLVVAAACGGTSTPTSGPVEAMRDSLGAFAGSPARQALERKIEDQVVSCMAERGFEYLPFVSAEPTGFGVQATTESAGLVETAAKALTGDAQVPSPEALNPNDAIRASLTPGELTNWSNALMGSGSEVAGETDPDKAGCKNAAVASVLGPDTMRSLWSIEDLDTEVAERSRRDADYRKALTATAHCMEKQGYNVEVVDDAVDMSSLLLAEAAAKLQISPPPQSFEELVATAGKEAVLGLVEELKQYEATTTAALDACESSAELGAAAEAARNKAEASVISERGADIERLEAAVASIVSGTTSEDSTDTSSTGAQR